MVDIESFSRASNFYMMTENPFFKKTSQFFKFIFVHILKHAKT